MLYKLYFIALPIFVAIDALWLSIIAKDFYSKQIGFLLKDNVNYWAAVIFYLLFILGLVVFVVNPSLAKQSALSALILGALFGLIAYATYDFTNLATIKDWPILVTVVDLIWGTMVGGIVSWLTYIIYTKI